MKNVITALIVGGLSGFLTYQYVRQEDILNFAKVQGRVESLIPFCENLFYQGKLIVPNPPKASDLAKAESDAQKDKK